MNKLSNYQIRRYSRHLILDKIGMAAQKRICDSSVLVVGAGGLGCPLISTLAGAGIGSLGIIDPDEVCFTNLHRQTLYREKDQCKAKVQCVKKAAVKLNSAVRIQTFKEKLNCKNAFQLICDYDIIADCTDNMESRYLISDFSVAAGKPVVSAAAIGVEGQMAVYNYKDGPCMRCLFPVKSPRDTVKSCADNGVLGGVPAVMGSLQALEVLKIAGQFGDILSSEIMYYNALSADFKKVKTLERNCDLCKKTEEINLAKAGTEEKSNKMTHFLDKICSMNTQNYNCDKGTCDDEVEKVPTVSCKELNEIIESKDRGKIFALIDVRDETQFQICRIKEAVNVPFSKILTAPSEAADEISSLSKGGAVYIICRRGISSAKAAAILHEAAGLHSFSVAGGVTSWAAEVDPNFPVY